MFSTIGAAAANPSQVAENLPSSLVGLMSAFPGKSPERLKPAYGMVYKFVVKLDALVGAEEDLGRWQSCTGLKMDFNPQAVKSGGEYTSIRYLPGTVTFPKVVLKRAVDKDSSGAVQKWLSSAATEWITNDSISDTNPGAVTITLHDPYGEVVLTWHLVNARPSAWSGPDLDANSSKVAIEVLELVHEGFEVVVGRSQGRGSAGESAQANQLTLTEEAGSRSIPFFNTPERITVDRNTERLTLDPVSPGNEKPDGLDATLTAGHKPNMTKLILSELWIVKGGKVTDVADLIDLLIEWMNLTKEKQGKAPAPYFLKLKWGNFEQKVWLSGVKAEFVRFSSNGEPIRAKVGLTLNLEARTTPAKGNPTSGGIPGRALHTLTMDQNLPLLAREHYGSETRWRDVAEANGIDDPLRTRPGQRLFLPAPSELGGRS
jgi:phage tail-like protein